MSRDRGIIQLIKKMQKQRDECELYKFLGQGAFSKVELRKKNNTIIACKSIVLDSKQNYERVYNEISILKFCKHPSIVKYVGINIKSFTELNIQLQYVKGYTLEQAYWSLEKPNEELIYYWVFQICLALHYLHQRSVVHRDIKPTNIMYSQMGVIKIIDFGLSRFLVNRQSAISGTPHYMAPQIFVHNKVHQKSDIWSLGVTIYQLCHRKLPFEDSPKKLEQFFNSILVKKVNYDRKVCSEQMQGLISSMLIKHPKKRLSAIEILSHPTITRRIQHFWTEYKKSTKDLN